MGLDSSIDRRLAAKLSQINRGQQENQRFQVVQSDNNVGATVTSIDGQIVTADRNGETVTGVMGSKVVRPGDRVFIVGGRVF